MHQLRFPLFLILIIAATSCGTRHNNFVSRSYHGTTTHYNYYFNARERVKQGAATLATAHEDKYDRVLSVFKYGDVNKAKGIFPDMDEAIKKASIAIQRHSIYQKSKHDPKLAERNKWIEDCYLLVGQAQFYKHDFWTAIETFQYTSSEYKDGPIRGDALIWLTRSYLELGKTTDAEYLLDFMKNDKNFPVRLKGDYAATAAAFHLQRNNIPKAIEEMENAAARTRKKDTRARYYFILAQLRQKQGELEPAFAAYSKVIKMNPPYELAFNARINRARCFDVNSVDAIAVKKELNKMLKDEKNKEYLDQIYYALAGIAQQEKKETEAINYLNLSVSSSVANANQKALSYKALGDIYYERPEYVLASDYYDSTITSLSNEHPDYFDILQRKNSLERLVNNLKIIMLEDSLQSLATLSPAEREARIDAVIARETEEQERIKKEKEEQQHMEEQSVIEEKLLKGQPRNIGNKPGGLQQGAWYFYNTSAIAAGVGEFMKKWGFRKLEDNWRRTEKESEVTAENEEEAVGPSIDSLADAQKALSDSLSKLDAGKRKEAYLKAIPGGEASIKESNIKLTEAFYNVGIIYKEQLANNKESVKAFETLDTRFPGNKYKLPSYYNLYRLYIAMNDSAGAEKYRSYLLNNFPESEYSKLINNPNYYAEARKKTQVLQVYYENTYRAFQNAQYTDVIERKAFFDEQFPKNNPLAGKFALLRALAIGKSQPIDNFELALEDVVRGFPKDSVSIRAKEILAFIKNSKQTVNVTPEDSTASKAKIDKAIDATAFLYAPETPHLFLILVPKDTANLLATVKPKLESFATANFSNEVLKAQQGNLDLDWQYLAVSGFKDKQSAMIFYSMIMEDNTVIGTLNTSVTQFFVISPTNMSQLSINKDVTKYAAFFQDKYLQ
ncbi:MAG: tetratricopeptide repeat protein [Bacteroidota bacterium]